jgi:hypothetical protein
MNCMRRAGATSATTLFGLAATLAVAHLAAPGWSRAVGLDVWNAPSLTAQVRSNVERGHELSEEIEESRRRFSLKEQIVQSMLDGQITLRQAADQFLELNHNHPASMQMIRATYMCSTDEENSLCNVVAVAVPRIQGSLSEKLVQMARLVSDFEHECKSHSHRS